MSGAETLHAIQELRKDDIIIAFMGPTGAGKSTFINLLSGQEGGHAGHGLESVTSQIQATRVRRPGYDDRIVLVDIPGFDDTPRSDMRTLQIIGDWLQKTYSKGVKLSGLIYLHRITDVRMAKSLHKNLSMFGALCGDAAMSQVRIVSTMWGEVEPEEGVQREQELREGWWRLFIEKGSKVERLRDTTGEEAWRIVDQLIDDCKKRDAVLLQEELVELGKRLNETAAGKTLYSNFQQLLADQKESLELLLAQVENSTDPSMKMALIGEYVEIKGQFRRTFQEMEKLKIPLGRRIVLFFFGKIACAKGVKELDSDAETEARRRKEAKQALHERIKELHKQRRVLEKQMNERGTDKQIVESSCQRYRALGIDLETTLARLKAIKESEA